MMNLTGITGYRDFIDKRLEDSSQIALVALNLDLTIIDHNSGFKKIIERNTNLNGIPLKDLLLPESRQLLAESFPDTSQVRLNFSLSPDSSVALLCWIHQTHNGYLIYGEQGMLADSDIMRTMTVLNNEMVGLTRELGRKNRILEQIQSKLKLRSEEIEQFATIVAHDFNSPLITIRSFLTELTNDIDTGNSANVKADLAYIEGAVKKLEELLGGLEQITRIGRDSAPPQQIDVDQLIRDCLATLGGPLRRKHIRTSIKETRTILTADPFYLGQLWQNLIENAVKYMGNQPQPRIDIGMEHNDREPIFYVRDNGIGIAPKDAERVFWIFNQLDINNPGSGLGLALVKKIIDRYQGKIWVESEGKDKGSCFKFTLTGALGNN